MTSIYIQTNRWEGLLRHLATESSRVEQAAFLFGKFNETSGNVSVIDDRLLLACDFEVQTADYLELCESARAELIKQAHDLNACLIEVHSHPWSWTAKFSRFDFRGLRETVPQLLWRLRMRPYIAVVVAIETFDALVWDARSEAPSTLDQVVVGELTLSPTNLSVLDWRRFEDDTV